MKIKHRISKRKRTTNNIIKYANAAAWLFIAHIAALFIYVSDGGKMVDMFAVIIVVHPLLNFLNVVIECEG